MSMTKGIEMTIRPPNSGGDGGGMVFSISEDSLPMGSASGNILDSPYSIDDASNITDGTYTLYKAPGTVIVVNSASDIEDLAVANVITVTTPTTFIFNVSYVGLTKFSIDAGASVRFAGVAPTPQYVYTGVGTFYSGEGSMELVNINLVSTSSATLADTTGSGYFSFEFLSMLGWGDLGIINKNGRVTFRFCSLRDIGTGFDVVNADVEVLNLKVLDGSVVGPLVSLSGNRVAAYTASGIKFQADSAASLFHIDPAMNPQSRFNMAQTSLISGSAFDVNGTQGVFTAVADASTGSTAVSVIDSPVSPGLARYTFTGPTLYSGQEVVATGFTTNDNYNGTLCITDTDGTSYFEALFIDYGSDESANFTVDSVVMTETSTALVNGDTIMLDTDGATDYDGGRTVFNQQTNSFQVSLPFTSTHTGTWDTSGIDQTDPRVLVNNSPGIQSSLYTAGGISNANAVTTSVSDGGYTDIDFSGITQQGTIERFKVVEDGTWEYTGLEPIKMVIYGSLTVFKGGATAAYRFTYAINDEVPTFATAHYHPVEVKTDKISIPVLLEVGTMVKGDTVQLKIAGDGTSDSITVSDASLVVGSV